MASVQKHWASDWALFWEYPNRQQRSTLTQTNQMSAQTAVSHHEAFSAKSGLNCCHKGMWLTTLHRTLTTAEIPYNKRENSPSMKASQLQRKSLNCRRYVKYFLDRAVVGYAAVSPLRLKYRERMFPSRPTCFGSLQWTERRTLVALWIHPLSGPLPLALSCLKSHTLREEGGA